MAFIYPFQGYRYNKDIVSDLNRVVTQPYDKITPEMQEEYYRRSPYSVIRITANMEKRNDSDTDYTEAGATFRQWLDRDVLLQDPQPAIYAYYQEYSIAGRIRLQKGFTALLDLGNSAAGIVPHERTLQAPKQDRLRLLRSTESNEDAVFMLYSDESLAVNRVMDEQISNRIPDLEVKDEYGVFHRLWAMTDPATLQTILDAMQKQTLYIADGHHRFETSVTYMNECMERNWTPAGIESYDKRMVTCFNIAAGVTILPTHRLLHNLTGFEARSFLTDIQKHFEVVELPSEKDLFERMKRESAGNVFGFYAGDRKSFCLLRLRDEALSDALLMRHNEAYRRLDVSILHILLLEHYLGIDESMLVSQSHVDYARDSGSSIEQVDAGRYQAVFFLNPTTAAQMQSLSVQGGRMPQKSTDFYPKLLTGLVFMKMNIAK